MDKETKIILAVAALSLAGFWFYKRFNLQRTTMPCPDGQKLVDSVCRTNPYRVINTTTATIGGDVTGNTYNAGEIVEVLREDNINIGRTADTTPVVIVIADGVEQAIVLSDVVKL